MDAGALFHLFNASGNPVRVVDFLVWLVQRSLGVERPRVLDVGAGSGRLMTPLCALGWDVVGREPRPDYRARDPRILPGGFEQIDDSSRTTATARPS